MNKLLLIILLAQAPSLPQPVVGTVSGRLTSPDGKPAPGVRVAAMPVTEPNTGSSTTVLAGISQADASGNYRLENVSPGRYYIVAGLVNAPTYFPASSTSAGATVVTVTSGGAIAGIDFRLLSAANLKVSGRVIQVSAVLNPFTPPALGQVSLLPRAPVQSELRNARVNPDGSFEIANVLPGTYSVMLAGQILKQQVMITLTDKDITDLELTAINPDATTQKLGLEPAWSLAGAWGGVAWDQKKGLLYAASSARRTLATIDAAGNISQEIPLAQAGAFLRIARFSADGQPSFLLFSTWSSSVEAYDSKGTRLWGYPPPGAPSGIDDAWPADLDGDNTDEVVVGFNGGTGAHVLNSKGELIAQSTGIGNVWHVAAGDVRGDGKLQPITTSAQGRVHIFSTDMKDRRDLDPGLYANMIRVGKLTEKDETATILVAGSIPNTQTSGQTLGVSALSADGTRKWLLRLEGNNGQPSAYSSFLAPGKPWLAIGMQGGLVYVIDAERGTIIATIDGQGTSPEVTWMADKETGSPLLIVSNRSKLTGYRVTPAK